MQKNEVYVTTQLQDEALWKRTIELGSVHWIAGTPPQDATFTVRVRHRAPLVVAQLQGDQLILDEPQRAVAPGQSVVIYDGDTCLGGGIVL